MNGHTLAPSPSGFYSTWQVAALFAVDPKTVRKWAVMDPPKIPSVRTPGGQLRYPAKKIDRLLRDGAR